MVQTWASTSDQDNPVSMSLQKTVSTKFNVPGGNLAASLDRASVKGELAIHGKVYEAFVDVQYAQTQAFLKENNITEVVLYRGHSTSVPAPSGEYLYANKVALQPISSFTAEYNTTGNFAGGLGTRAIIAIKAPAEQIFATPATGPGCLHESEFVLLGGSEIPAHVVIGRGDAGSGTFEGFKAAVAAGGK